jgi:hypothetical protein
MCTSGQGRMTTWRSVNPNTYLLVEGKLLLHQPMHDSPSDPFSSDGKYGLYVDDTLLDGSSAMCPTFANEPLCSELGHKQGDTVTFECVGLEVWGVGG